MKQKFKCALFENFETYRKIEGLKELLLQDVQQNREAFIEKAAYSIKMNVLQSTQAETALSKQVVEFRHKGVDIDSLVIALATAWYEDASEFEVEIFSRHEGIRHSQLSLFFWATILGVVTSFIVVYGLKFFAPQIAAGLLVLEPVLALFGFVFIIIFYEILRRFSPHR